MAQGIPPLHQIAAKIKSFEKITQKRDFDLLPRETLYNTEHSRHFMFQRLYFFSFEVHDVCLDGFFGKQCEYTCHCDSVSCNKTTGACINGTCAPGWAGTDCQQGMQTGNIIVQISYINTQNTTFTMPACIKHECLVHCVVSFW